MFRLAKVGAGKTIVEVHKNQTHFRQDDIADTVFYLQKGKVKLTVVSPVGKGEYAAQSQGEMGRPGRRLWPGARPHRNAQPNLAVRQRVVWSKQLTRIALR